MSNPNNTALSLLKQYALQFNSLNVFRDQLNTFDFFKDLLTWSFYDIYYNCNIIDGFLYTEDNHLLSIDGRCMDEEIPYFVNQHTGYCGDDFYGTLFICVDDSNTFVAISFEC